MAECCHAGGALSRMPCAAARGFGGCG
jgi:hypothetical protein